MYVKACLEKEKAALLVVVGGLLDGRKVVLAIEPGYQGIDRELVWGAARLEENVYELPPSDYRKW